MTDWECICINDGSPDGSGAILDEYARKDARFTAIHQENRGVSAARNAGLSRARGTWTAFMTPPSARRKPRSTATESARTSTRAAALPARKPRCPAGTSTFPRKKRAPSCATC